MISLPNTIGLFPLGEVVLFPDTLLPLQVFEPRYRKLVADALDGDRTIGMVLVRGAAGPIAPAPEDDPDHPEIYPVGCAGRIVEHELLDDGRSVMVLRGTLKFRVKRELAGEEPYRRAELQALYEAPVPAESMRLWRDDLRERMVAYLRALSGDVDTLEKVFAKLDVEGLVNYLSATLPMAVVEKQGLLECATAEQRFRRLCDILDFKTAEARLGLTAHRGADS